MQHFNNRSQDKELIIERTLCEIRSTKGAIEPLTKTTVAEEPLLHSDPRPQLIMDHWGTTAAPTTITLNALINKRLKHCYNFLIKIGIEE
jgi:hypothetical protein